MFSVDITIMLPISLFLVVIKVGTDGCKLPREDGEEVEEAATSAPAAKQISADAATATTAFSH